MAEGRGAVDRVIDIFEVFRHGQRPLSLTELAAAARLPKSSCHVIVGTLIARGYLYSLEHPRALYPTQRLLDVAHDIVAGDPFLEHVLPRLEALRDASTETVILGKRQGERVVYLQVLDGLHSIRYSAKPGDLKPLHSSAIGKALLGAQKEVSLHDWAVGQSFPRITSGTICDPEQLVADIQRGRSAGFFQTRGENVEDVWAVAAFFRAGRETMAIGVAGPRHRMQSSIESCAQQLLTTCNLVSRQLAQTN
ncbi:IclR family transcriptional regulator [Pseudorhodoferax soli]|uniref:IclR family transcriptional regulator n=2 Tax=Pseudorhodoferax soli TaxID=545864 RepID=A0A368XPU1_9BURK|nr:IclR family transcriptional regulator [Pseudorhodoferax soli]